MFLRGLAVSSLCAFVATVNAGVNITLVANPDKPAYAPGEMVAVDVFLTQTPAGSEHLLRLVQFDLGAASNDAFGAINLVSTHPAAQGGINFWDFSSTPACGTPANCGQGHFVDDEKVGPGILGPDLLAIAYYFVNSADLGANPAAQINLTSGDPVRVGRLNVVMPLAGGTYTLDLINTGNTNPNRGAIVYYGFGLAPGDPVTILRPGNTAPNDLTGGTRAFTVVPEDGAALIASAPVCAAAANGSTPNSTLWRSSRNFILLDFDRELPAGNPPAGSIRVRELVAGGGFGEDVTGAFTATVEDNQAGTRRRIRLTQNTGMDIPPGTPGNLADGLPEHRRYYGITHEGGWNGVDPFKLDILVQVGDASGDARVNSFDVSAINGNVPFPCINTTTCAGLRTDTSGDNRVNSFDVSTVNGRLPSLFVPKPAGHSCSP